MESVTEYSSMLVILFIDDILNLELSPKVNSRSSKKDRVDLTSI